MSEVEEARRRIRQLLLSGDNTLKNRDGAERIERARGRYEQALAIAREAGLEDSIEVIVQRRLEALAQAGGGGADAA
jgi:hypothetical protein